MLALLEEPNWQIDLHAPISPQVRRILRERIIHNDLKPDQKISETEIASQYGVSRQPVREAFIRLAAEGLVRVLPQRGTAICRISLAAVLDARFIREAIEADIVRILAQAPTSEQIGMLNEHLDRQNQAMKVGAPTFIEADEDFHRTLAQMVGKAGLWQKVQGLKAQMDRVRFLSLGHFPMRELVEQHAAIVESIASGDAAQAEVALRTHLRKVLFDLPQIVKSNSDFFDATGGGVEDKLVTIQGGDIK